MKAWYVTGAGKRPELGELPVPAVKDGTVLVRVKAAGLNAIDNVLAAGMMAEMLPHEYPLVLGRDAAGVVERVGAGVDHVAVGDEVFGHVLLAPPIMLGTLAEYALLPAASVVRKPANLDFSAAAALPLAAAAAVAAVAAIDPRPDQTVLVNGASGGVGSYVVQLLGARKVKVVATGSPDQRERLTGLGATTVLDRAAGPIGAQVRAVHSGGVDALINLAGNADEEIPLDAVARGGKVATTTMGPSESALTAAGLTGTNVMAAPVRETTEPLAAQSAAGELTIDVTTVLPFDQADQGLATLASGQAKGKIVVLVG
jgi:NADPH:quinone reductase-like Zn-dependent oxidoreductase